MAASALRGLTPPGIAQRSTDVVQLPAPLR